MNGRTAWNVAVVALETNGAVVILLDIAGATDAIPGWIVVLAVAVAFAALLQDDIQARFQAAGENPA